MDYYTLYLDESETHRFNKATSRNEAPHFCMAGVIIEDNTMYALLRKYDTQTNGFDCGCLILHTLMSILSAEMDDKHDYISWWLYESTEDKTVTWTENGVERSVDLTTPEALYDYIVESHLERERSGGT